MRWFIAAVVVFGASVTAAVAPGAGRRSTPAFACGIGPTYLDEEVRKGAVVALVEAISVGDAVNRAPTLTPTATPSPTATTTPAASPTRTPLAATRTALAKTPTEEPELTAPTSVATEPRPTLSPESLAGIGASVRVVKPYAGATDGALLDVDALARSREEQAQRFVESTRLPPPCPILTPRYEAGARYLVVLDRETGGSLTTTRQLRLADDGTVAGPIGMTLITYQRFFSDLPAITEAPEGSVPGFAYITTERIPLARVERMIRAVISHADVRIVPPETGSGGLAAGR